MKDRIVTMYLKAMANSQLTHEAKAHIEQVLAAEYMMQERG